MAGSAAQKTHHPLLKYLDDPVAFASGILRHDLWQIPRDILRALATSRRVAVKACHASSKSFTAAEAVLWWITRYPDGTAVTTAPTWSVVKHVIWQEIHKAAQQSRIAYPPINQTELHLGPGNYAIGLSTNEGVRFQGFHGRVLVVIDEAPGVKASIWEAVEGIRAGGDVRVLALGQPLVPGGPFYDAFTSQRDTWKTFTINAFETPNLCGLSLEKLLALKEEQLDKAARPYLITRRWVKEMQADWGTEHPFWLARVLGEFPLQSDKSLISLAWLEAAKTRELHAIHGEKVAGVDVAGPGKSETVVCLRHGPRILAIRAWPDADPRGQVVRYLGEHRDGLTVNVDAVGIGYNFALHLKDQGFRVNLINVGDHAANRERFTNKKAEHYWGLRERFAAGDISGLTDERTIGQLASILYEPNARGQIEIESKDKAAARGLASPDRAEAVMLAFAAAKGVVLAAPVEVGVRPSPWRVR